MPTAAIMTFGGQKLEPYMNPELAKSLPVKLAVSTNYAKGTLLGEVIATPGLFDTYADAGAGGLDVAKAILPYDCQTDAAGLITFSATASQAGGEFGQQSRYVDVYVVGVFRTTELVGLTAAALADLGRLYSGTIADGIIGVGL